MPSPDVAGRLLRERALGPWSLGVVSPEGPRPLGSRTRGRSRPREAARRPERAARGRLGDRGAARAVRRVGRAGVRLPSRRLGPRPCSGADGARCLSRVMARRIAILGCGKIGEALVAGLLSSGWRTKREIVVTARRQERADELHEQHGVEAILANAEAVAGAGLVVVAVKPYGPSRALLTEIGSSLTSKQTVLCRSRHSHCHYRGTARRRACPLSGPRPTRRPPCTKASPGFVRGRMPKTSTSRWPRNASPIWAPSSACQRGT